MNRLGLQKGFLAAFLLLAALAAVVWAVAYYRHGEIPVPVVHWLWRGAVAMFVGYAATRRSLTVWIVLGMLLGVEVGYDLKSLDDATRLRYAANLQVLSSIFLRLIKTVVAPLIFG